jgi:hypothetical protein
MSWNIKSFDAVNQDPGLGEDMVVENRDDIVKHLQHLILGDNFREVLKEYGSDGLLTTVGRHPDIHPTENFPMYYSPITGQHPDVHPTDIKEDRVLNRWAIEARLNFIKWSQEKRGETIEIQRRMPQFVGNVCVVQFIPNSSHIAVTHGMTLAEHQGEFEDHPYHQQILEECDKINNEVNKLTKRLRSPIDEKSEAKAS